MNIVRDIVVIGAGLGGLSAIAKIASTWPEDLPVSVLISQPSSNVLAQQVIQVRARDSEVPSRPLFVATMSIYSFQCGDATNAF